MDATKLLENDHRKVEQLFKRAEKLEDDKQKLQVFDQIKTELLVHAEIEELLFYPACRKFEQLDDLVNEALEEHAQAKGMIMDIDELREEALRLEAKVKVLQEDIDHHVKEEEGELFPKVRKLMGADQLKALGAQMEQAKARLLESLRADGTIPKGQSAPSKGMTAPAGAAADQGDKGARKARPVQAEKTEAGAKKSESEQAKKAAAASSKKAAGASRGSK